jgi:ArsR family transcriptional regulator
MPSTAVAAPELMRLLADPLRAQFVALLSVEQLCTCHLIEATGAGQTNVSNHLRALRQAGVVEREAHGRFTYYRLRPEPLEAVSAQLGDLAAAAQIALQRKRPCT